MVVDVLAEIGTHVRIVFGIGTVVAIDGIAARGIEPLCDGIPKILEDL